MESHFLDSNSLIVESIVLFYFLF